MDLVIDWNKPDEELWEQWRPHFSSDDDAIAHAIWVGNRLIKSRGYISKRIYYSIKDELIRRHAEAGFPVRSEIAYCRQCGGVYTSDQATPCSLCRGSGIYQKRILYGYRFQVAGQNYSFHSYVRPKALVRPGSAIIESGGRFTDDEIAKMNVPWHGALRLLSWMAEHIWLMVQSDSGDFFNPPSKSDQSSPPDLWPHEARAIEASHVH